MKKKVKIFLFALLFIIIVALSFYVYIIIIYTTDRTIYALNYSEERFNKVKLGMSIDQVHSIMGRPIELHNYNPIYIWDYSENLEIIEKSYGGIKYHRRKAKLVKFDERGFVVDSIGTGEFKLIKGMSKDEILKILGEPNTRIHSFSLKCEFYTTSPDVGLFKIRSICYNEYGKVIEIDKNEYYVD